MGAALALLTVNDIKMDKLKVAEICANGEHFVGTSGGGMDHAGATVGFRSGEGQLNSVHMLCKDSDHLKYIGDIARISPSFTQNELDRVVYDFLGTLSDTYLLKDLLSIFNLSKDDLADLYQHVLRGAELSEIAGGYNLKNRFKHVYTECQRVNKAVECLKTNNKLEIGKLLDASHNSLSNDYDVSTPEIDSIVKMLKIFGALGARLVGAGFGGMVLVLSDSSHADELIENMQNSFYSGQPVKSLNETVIRCNTADGAGLL